MNRRETWIAYVLLIFGGVWGIHKFYLNRVGWGLAYLFTGGLFFIGVIVDLFTLPGQVRRFNREIGYSDPDPVRYTPQTRAMAEMQRREDLIAADRKLRDFSKRLNNLEAIIHERSYK